MATGPQQEMIRGRMHIVSEPSNQGWSESYYMKTADPVQAVNDFRTMAHLRTAIMPVTCNIVYACVSLLDNDRDSRMVDISGEFVNAIMEKRGFAEADHVSIGYQFRFETQMGKYAYRIYRGITDIGIEGGHCQIPFPRLQYSGERFELMGLGTSGSQNSLLLGGGGGQVSSDNLIDNSLVAYWYGSQSGDYSSGSQFISTDGGSGSGTGGTGTGTGESGTGTGGTGTGTGGTGSGTGGTGGGIVPIPGGTPMPNAEGAVPLGPTNNAADSRFREFNSTADSSLPAWLVRQVRATNYTQFQTAAWASFLRVTAGATVRGRQIDRTTRTWTKDDWRKVAYIRVAKHDTGRPFGISRGRRAS